MVKIGDLVKINFPDRPLDGYIAVVDELRSWGVIAYVPTKAGKAWIRLAPENYTMGELSLSR